MTSLNELEKSVLQTLIQKVPANLAPLLKSQIDNASVVSRENTGAGFYTELDAGDVSQPVDAKVIQGVSAEIEGFEQPMLFLLFLRDGAIHTLEGAAITDSTVGIDFSEVRFRVQSS
ncbi:MAG: hypothetical protein WAV72_24295 [Bradyrhizobium sp.]